LPHRRSGATPATGPGAPDRKQSRSMDKPPKLWRLLVMLAVIIAAIIWLNHYAATMQGVK